MQDQALVNLTLSTHWMGLPQKGAVTLCNVEVPVKIHLPAAHSASGEISSGRGDRNSTSQCLKRHTISVHSFTSQMYMEPLLSAVRVSRSQVRKKSDQVLSLTELSLVQLEGGCTKRKDTNEIITELD